MARCNSCWTETTDLDDQGWCDLCQEITADLEREREVLSKPPIPQRPRCVHRPAICRLLSQVSDGTLRFSSLYVYAKLTGTGNPRTGNSVGETAAYVIDKKSFVLKEAAKCKRIREARKRMAAGRTSRCSDG